MYLEIFEKKGYIFQLVKSSKRFMSKRESFALVFRNKNILIDCKTSPFTMGREIIKVRCDKSTKDAFVDEYINIYGQEGTSLYVLLNFLKGVFGVAFLALFAFSIYCIYDGDLARACIFLICTIIAPAILVLFCKVLYTVGLIKDE